MVHNVPLSPPLHAVSLRCYVSPLGPWRSTKISWEIMNIGDRTLLSDLFAFSSKVEHIGLIYKVKAFSFPKGQFPYMQIKN